jgi:hypothetical protein
MNGTVDLVNKPLIMYILFKKWPLVYVSECFQINLESWTTHVHTILIMIWMWVGQRYTIHWFLAFPRLIMISL